MTSLCCYIYLTASFTHPNHDDSSLLFSIKFKLRCVKFYKRKIYNSTKDTIKVYNSTKDTIKVYNSTKDTIKVYNSTKDTIKVYNSTKDTIKVYNSTKDTIKVYNSTKDTIKVYNSTIIYSLCSTIIARFPGFCLVLPPLIRFGKV
jgi:hypothetical protein